MTKAIAPLSQSLAGGELFAVLISSPPTSPVLGELASARSCLEGLPILRMPLDALLDGGPPLEAELDNSTIERAQFVLLLPPFGRAHAKPSRHDVSEIAARNVAAALPSDKHFACALLPRSISGRRPNAILKEIMAERHISGVVELLATDLYEQRTSLRVCVVVLKTVEPPRVAFVSIPSRSQVDLALGEYSTLVSEGGRTIHGFALEERIDSTRGFLPNQLDPERERRIRDVSAIGGLRRLGDLCEISRGLSPAVRARREPESGDVPVLSARAIRNGTIAVDEIDEWIEMSAGTPLQAGDIVLRSIKSRQSSIQAAEVYKEDLPMIAGRHVLVLRSNSDPSSVEHRVLGQFIGSRRFSEQLISDQAHLMQITARELADVLVPVPDSDFLIAFQSVESALKEFEEWREESAALLDSSLDSDDLANARVQLIRSSNLLRQRAGAARLLDNLAHLIATRYPLPVAYRFRSALAAQGGSEALKAVIKTQEVLQAYLSIMALTAAKAAGVKIGYVKDIRRRLTRRQSGITLGDWRGILEDVSRSKAFRRLANNHPFVEVRGFFKDSDVRRASDRLNNQRHNESHLREAGPGDAETILHNAWSDLEALFLGAEFLTEYRLIQVLETRWDSIEHRNTIVYRNLAGDHPIVPRQLMSVETSNVEADSLYLVDLLGKLHLIRPLLIGADCPRCGHWSTFHPDRVLADGTIEAKSLEHGHPKAMPESFGRALAAIGWLEQDGYGKGADLSDQS